MSPASGQITFFKQTKNCREIVANHGIVYTNAFPKANHLRSGHLHLFLSFSPCQWMSIATLWVSMQLRMLFVLFQFICPSAGALPRPCWLAGQKQRQNNNASPDMNITNHKNISTLARLEFTLHFTRSWSIISHYSNTCRRGEAFLPVPEVIYHCTNIFLTSI